MNKQTYNRSSQEKALWLVIVGLAAWIVPGAGHLLIRERKRAVILFIVVAGIFLTGLHIGSIGVVNPVDGRIWFYAQILCSPMVGVLGTLTQNGQYPVYGRPCDIGQLYTGVAGLLNLLSILSAIYMAYCGRGEMIGREEEPDNG